MTLNNPYQISRGRHYSTLNISETIQDRDDFSLIYAYISKTVVFSGINLYRLVCLGPCTKKSRKYSQMLFYFVKGDLPSRSRISYLQHAK